MKNLHIICFLLVLNACTTTNSHLSKITAKTIKVDSTLSASKEISEFITPYKEKLVEEMQRVLSYNPKELNKTDGNMQSSAGNFMADLCVEMANSIYKKKTNKSVDFAMLNHGGIRAIVPAGKVTVESAFKIMPFDNELVVVTLSGDKIKELVQFFIAKNRAHPLSKNIELVIKNDGYSLKINGKPFNEAKSYNVVTSDYLQNGGDRMNFFKNPEKLVKLDYKVRDAIIDYLEKVDTIQTKLDHRVILR